MSELNSETGNTLEIANGVTSSSPQANGGNTTEDTASGNKLRSPPYPPTLPQTNTVASTSIDAKTSGDTPTTDRRLAYMFYVTSDTYGCAALHLMDTLVHSVGMNTSRIDLVVLHSTTVSARILARIQATVPARMIPVDKIHADAQEATWKESLTKLHVFREWGYDRVVYMDADAVPLQSLDHLFDLPPATLYAPTAYWLQQPWFASTLLVLEPKHSEFEKLLAWTRERGAAAGFDMDILNRYFQDTVRYLPGDYTVLNSDFRAKPEAKNKLYATTTELKQHAKLVHFSCKPDGSYGKPWTTTDRDLGFAKKQGLDPLFADLFTAYWRSEVEKCHIVS
jgi:hypothetical protein